MTPLAEQLKLGKGQGFILDNIDPATAVARAGLRNKDLLIGLNDGPVMNKPGVFLKDLSKSCHPMKK